MKQVNIFCALALLFCVSKLLAEKGFSDLQVRVAHILNTQTLSPCDSVVQAVEHSELKLDQVADALNVTQTAFGAWGLRTLLVPLVEHAKIAQRQSFIAQLLENDPLFAELEEQLAIIAQTQNDFLAIFDDRDALYLRAQDNYFDCRFTEDLFDYPLTERLSAKLNQSWLGLEASFISSFGSGVLSVITYLCLDGLRAEVARWLLSNNSDTDIDLIGGLKTGLQAPYLQHSFTQTDDFKERRSDVNFSGWKPKDFFRIMLCGSFGDRYQLALDGFQRARIIGLPFDDIAVEKGSSMGAFLSAAVPTLIHDFFWLRRSASMLKNLYTQYRVVHAMRNRLIGAAHCLAAIIRIRHIFDRHNVTVDAATVVPHLVIPFDHSLPALSKLYASLGAATFKNSKSHFYFRGKVLQGYYAFKCALSDLVPYMQEIAHLDAYVAVVRTYKNWQKNNTPVCFAEFVQQDQEPAMMILQNGWLIITAHHGVVLNNAYFGGDNPNKMILTGPNGCGKSCFLKMVGQAAVLAQSFGIVPAERYCAPCFAKIGTSIDSQEDISGGISSYMAQKESMNRIASFIRECTGHRAGLFLIDEPYRGTVEAESAKRILAFCRDIQNNDCSIVALATHVQEPTKLLDEALFAQGQAEVVVCQNTFKRTFKIIPGSAIWWFEDAELRSAFVDWISSCVVNKK